MIENLFVVIFFIFLSEKCVSCYKIEYLSDNWTVTNLNESISVPATVPGGIYSDLTDAKILNDIYYRFNDIEYRWVANETWTYQTKFYVKTNDLNSSKYINLVFEGLDAYSKIYLNGRTLGSTSNMFVRHVFDVTSVIKGENNLAVTFFSPIKNSKKLYDNQAEYYIVPPKCTPMEYNGECHVNFVRKMQASFGWDWGPAFPSVGIWKPLYLEYFNTSILRDVTIDTQLKDTNWVLNVTVFLESYNQHVTGSIKILIETDIEVIIVFNDVNGTVNSNNEFITSFTVNVPQYYVKLWWPNGYGEQNLYELKVTYFSKNHRESKSKHMNIGFRTIKLVQKPLQKGLSFYFEVNNIPIFAKGSNWIPANILPEKGQNEKDITFLLGSAKEANMNMLRVWGGGVYESDFFYKTADKMGILIWQDFMFACNMYPVFKEFLESVKLEVTQQVRRLQYHPSLAIWAGNNENEAALRDGWYGTNKNFELYKEDYVTLYVDVIKENCISNDPTRPFVTSSPTNGLKSDQEGYVAKNPYDTHFGDQHYYNYFLDGWDKNLYPKPRFSSEYGFQSIPCIETLKSATNITSDLALGSEFMRKRQHHNGGYYEILYLLKQHLQLPSKKSNVFNDYLNTFAYFSQISQAMSIKAQTEHYRQWRSSLDKENNGLTMGALYWQLNDVWQAPSWSSIDFQKRWKMLHYFAKKFFHPVLITANLNEPQMLSIYVISDLKYPLYNNTITIFIYKWDSFTPIFRDDIKILETMAGYSTEVAQFYLPKYLENAGCGQSLIATKACFIVLHLNGTDKNDLTYSNFVFPERLKQVKGLMTPNLKVDVKSENNESLSNKFNIKITSDQIALFVWLETPKHNGIFSDNGFLQVTETKEIIYKISNPISVDELRIDIKITSLRSEEHL